MPEREIDRVAINDQQQSPFICGYITAALWSSSDSDGGESLDDTYGWQDIADAAFREMCDECVAFQAENAADLAGIDETQAGIAKSRGRCAKC